MQSLAPSPTQDLLFLHNPLSMWIYDTETFAFLAVNEAAVRSYGYSRDEFLGMTILQIRFQEEQQRLHDVAVNGRADWVDAGIWHHITKSGKTLHVKVVSHRYPFADRPGRLVIAVDVSAQVQAEVETAGTLDRAKRHTVQLQRISRVGRQLTIHNTPAQLLQEITHAARQIIGAHQAATSYMLENAWVTGVHVASFSDKYGELAGYTAPPDGTGIYRLVCETNQPMRMTQTQLQAHPAWRNFGAEQDKHPALHGWVAAPLIGHDDKNMGLIQLTDKAEGEFDEDDEAILVQLAQMASGMLEKLALQEEVHAHAASLEERVAERTVQLERANSELEAFTYSVSHDLRAPLRAIDGFSQMLQNRYRDALDATGIHYLERIRVGTQRMTQLIDALLDLSRVNRQELKRKRVNLSLMAQSIVDELHQSEPERAVTLQIAENLITERDPHLLRVVIQNLLDNAWKFTRNTENPSIRFFSKELDNGRRAFGVADNGDGFNMAHADRLFGVFQRLHRAEQYPGTGIGLAIVQRIVHRHGGEIWAEGEPSRGAAFWFALESEA